MTGEGGGSRRNGAAGRNGGAESRRRSGRVPFAGQSYEILRDSAAARPFFLHRSTVIRRAPRPLFPPRLVRSKSCAFSVSVPQFFRRSPALFSFGGRVALLRGVKCAVPRACVSHTRQPLFVFSLHRFTYPAQCADYLPIVGEDFAFSPSPRSSLPHGGRCRGRQVQRARSEISQFLLMRR